MRYFMIAFLLLATVACADQVEEKIVIKHADSATYLRQEHTLVLEGHVEVEMGGRYLKADRITVIWDEQDRMIIKVVAEGNVSGSAPVRGLPSAKGAQEEGK